MPTNKQTMCWDPICTVTEVYCCSEHYLWLWVAFWWWLLGWWHRLQCIVIALSFLRFLKLHKLAVGKLDLSRGGLTRCHGSLDHGLNLHWNIPLRMHHFYNWSGAVPQSQLGSSVWLTYKHDTNIIKYYIFFLFTDNSAHLKSSICFFFFCFFLSKYKSPFKICLILQKQHLKQDIIHSKHGRGLS